jgi:DMSO reductase anchor subunit
VLDYGTTEELSLVQPGQILWQLPATEHPFPLPNYSRTEPHLVIRPHTGMNSPLAKAVANLEEVQPPHGRENLRGIAAVHELPLVGFTLLTQMAAGMAVCSLALSAMPLPVLLAIGILLISGGLISFLHLGRKRNAWRSVIHLKKSWLSREILMAVFFGAAWVIAAGVRWFWDAPPNPWPMAILGFGLIISMSQVYHLRAVPAWNRWCTLAAFLVSAAVLGALGVNLAAPRLGWTIIAGIGMMIEMAMLAIQPVIGKAYRARIALLGLGIVGTLSMALAPQANQAWLAVPVLLIALAAEVIGRWRFYADRVPFPMLAI